MSGTKALGLHSTKTGQRLPCVSSGAVLERFARFLTGDADLALRVTARIRAASEDAASSPDDVDACTMRAVTRASWQVLREAGVAGTSRPLLRLTALEQQVLFRRLVLGEPSRVVAVRVERSLTEVRRIQRTALTRLADEPAGGSTGEQGSLATLLRGA